MPKVTLEYKELVKTRILESAHRVFSQKGYREAKMDEIAEGLGLSKPALYRYYMSKEELFREILRLINHAASKALRETSIIRDHDSETFRDLTNKWRPTPRRFLSATTKAPIKSQARKILGEENITRVDIVGGFIEMLKSR